MVCYPVFLGRRLPEVAQEDIPESAIPSPPPEGRDEETNVDEDVKPKKSGSRRKKAEMDEYGEEDMKPKKVSHLTRPRPKRGHHPKCLLSSAWVSSISTYAQTKGRKVNDAVEDEEEAKPRAKKVGCIRVSV